MSRARLVLVILIVVGLGVFIHSCIKDGEEYRKKYGIEERETQPIKQTVPYVDIRTVYQEYRNNEVRGDEKYRNRTLTFNVHINLIEKDILDRAYVEEHMGDYGLAGIRCYFSNSSELSSFNKGADILVVGECTGMIMHTVIFEHCVLSN